jgi:hypothetical protein
VLGRVENTSWALVTMDSPQSARAVLGLSGHSSLKQLKVSRFDPSIFARSSGAMQVMTDGRLVPPMIRCACAHTGTTTQ